MLDSLLTLVHFAGVALGFPLVSLALGWGLLARVPHLDRAERFAASLGLSFAAFATSQLLAFMTGAPPAVFSLVALVLLGVAALVLTFCSTPPEQRPGGVRWLSVLLGLGYVHLVCIQGLLACYAGSDWYGDWLMHYWTALIYRGDVDQTTAWEAGGYTLASRTPLFNLASAFLLSLTGKQFWCYQVGAALLSASVLAPIFLLLRDLFGLRAARFGVLLAMLNLWLLHNAWFTWPKMLAAYYAILGLHFFIRWARARQGDPEAATWCFRLFWCSELLGYMTHQAIAVYAAPLFLYAVWVMWFSPKRRLAAVDLVVLATTAIVVLLPWYLLLVQIFGVKHILGATPVTRMDEPRSLGYMVHSIPYNVVYSTVPLTLCKVVWQGPYTFSAYYEGLTYLYFSLFTGTLTLSLVLFLGVLALIRLARPRNRSPLGRRWPPEWLAVWLFALLGGLGATFLHHVRMYPHGVAHSAAFPSAIVLTALAWGVLSGAPRVWRTVVVCGIVTEFLLMFWSHVYIAATEPMILDPSNNNLDQITYYHLEILRIFAGRAGVGFMVLAVAVQMLAVGLLVAPRLGLWLSRRIRVQERRQARLKV